MNRDGDREVVREGRERQIRQDHRRVEHDLFTWIVLLGPSREAVQSQREE
jgi:hypothetical protein